MALYAFSLPALWFSKYDQQINPQNTLHMVKRKCFTPDSRRSCLAAHWRSLVYTFHIAGPQRSAYSGSYRRTDRIRLDCLYCPPPRTRNSCNISIDWSYIMGPIRTSWSQCGAKHLHSIMWVVTRRPFTVTSGTQTRITSGHCTRQSWSLCTR